MTHSQIIEIPELEGSPDITPICWSQPELDFIEKYCHKDSKLVRKHLNETYRVERTQNAVDQKMRDARRRGC